MLVFPLFSSLNMLRLQNDHARTPEGSHLILCAVPMEAH